jgi:hypothetical protein
VFGSHAILGQYPDAPDTLRQSVEADIAPATAVDMVDAIDAALGELSQFHETFGFYVHGVSIEAAILPEAWRTRTIAVCNENTRNTTGLCVEAHDLAVSKLVAYRDKDKRFVRVLILENLIDPTTLLIRLRQLPNHEQVTEELLQLIEAWIQGVIRDRDQRT